MAHLEKQRLEEAAAKQQGTDRAIQEAQARAEMMDGYRAAVMKFDARRKEEMRSNVNMRKEATLSQQSQARSAQSLRAVNLVQTRQQQLQGSYELYQQQKKMNIEQATEAAARRQAAMHGQQAQRIATSRHQRFSTAAEKLAEQQRCNEAAERQMMTELARRDALVARRQQEEAKREREIQSKQLTELVTRHYAKEFELTAMIQNKVPQIPPELVNTLNRYNLRT